ncbi:MAG: hypothetical protein ACJAX5_003371 [Patiriisocius sp.]|jgi:hypothetical protein
MPTTNRQQRDLDWSIRQPGLIRSDNLWPTDDWFANLAVPQVDNITPPPPRFRLGIHFEKLFQRWLDTQIDYSTIAANLQVHGEGRTLGEFDLIVEAPTGTEHWELAVKFYINQQHANDPKHWFGPDPADTLATKLNRLTDHQLKLPFQPEARTLLEARDIQLSNQRCIMKGRLYHSWDAYQTNQFHIPSLVNPNHCKGWWLSSEDLSQLVGKRLVYLDKSLWLSEVAATDVTEVLDVERVKRQVTESKQIALQFAIVDNENAECSRGFVLKPDWFEQVNAQHQDSIDVS